jgi:hypothetical protein
MKYVAQTAELVEIDDPMLKIEWCGRICYNSRDKIKPGSAEKFVAGILRRGHLSVLRHVWLYTSTPYNYFPYSSRNNEGTWANVQAWLGFVQQCPQGFCPRLHKAFSTLVPGTFTDPVISWFTHNTACIYKDAPTVELLVSEAIATQFVRHSTLAFSVMSDRYVKRDELEIVRIDPHAPIDSRYEDAWRAAERSYLDLVSHGVPAQEARRVLPNAVSKRMVVTGDMVAWKHFFKLRCASDADPMARDAAFKIKALKPFQNMEL